MGYVVSRQPFDCEGGAVRNIEVEIPGRLRAAEIIVDGAHYDSARCAPGANDNGSGVAMVLELARHFKSSRPERTLRFVLFVNEEPPYFGTAGMGSMVYANRSRARGENIKAMLTLETVGYFDETPGCQKYPIIFRPFFPDTGNFIAFISNFKSRDLLHRSISVFRSTQPFPSEGIATFPWIVGVNWSDHHAFWKNGYRALMITDTAPFRYPYYHTENDTPDQVNYLKMARLFSGVCEVVQDWSGDAAL
jgi:Zn-dependent M28 family amino/carboxypeptidase